MKTYHKQVNFKKRSSARRTAMQALYTWIISKEQLSIIEGHYLAERNPKNFDLQYFKELFAGIVNNYEKLDLEIAKYSDRAIDQLDPIELCILRLASYELFFCEDLPFKVVISEALELAGMFASDTSYKFINSVLDRLAKAKIKL